MSLYDVTSHILYSLGYFNPVILYVLNYLFCMFFLYLLVRLFVLYLLIGCISINTLRWSLYASWFQGPNIYLLFLLIFLNYFLIGMDPIIRSLKILNRMPCIGLVMKYPIISFLGRYSIFNYFVMIQSVMKNKWMLLYLVKLLLDYLPLFSRIMALLLSW